MSSLYLLPPEALRMICNILIQPDRDQERPQWFLGLNTLLILARTSRVFHEYALNAIWSSIPGYGILLFTLPPDAWTAEELPAEWPSQRPAIQLSITRPLVANDLARLKHCSWRVRQILPHRDCQPGFPPLAARYRAAPSVLDALLKVNDGLLLPNLTVLDLESPDIFSRDRWSRADQELFYSALHVLFGPKIISFHHQGRKAPREAYKASLGRLTDHCPNVRHLYLSLWPWESPLALVVSAAICRFHHIQTLWTDTIPISPEAFLHLAQLPFLTELNAKMQLRNDERFQEIFGDAEDKTYFPRLRSLSLTHQFAIPPLITLFRAMSSRILSTIKLEVVEGKTSSEEVKELLSAIAFRSGSSSVRSVSVNAGYLRNEDEITLLTLLPLLKLNKLTVVSIASAGRFAIDDIALTIMACNWPHIRRLELGPGRMAHDAPKPPATLAGLVPLAQECPHLETLAIALNTDIASLPSLYRDSRPGAGYVQRRLTSLRVGRSRIEDEVAVAAFLSDLFPKICEVDNDFACEDDLYESGELEDAERARITEETKHRERWMKVMWELIPLFVKVRKQERKWARDRSQRSLHG
ncbi:hypothetical protein OH77DRAFT_1490568 [Trametes cingulata]|nr:hypothetical protein OH77DRAFT_1490568 [Trametes cingulata]